jgi:hypothetical protein
MQRLGRWSNGTSFGVGGLIISADSASARRRCLRRSASTSTAAEVEEPPMSFGTAAALKVAVCRAAMTV